MNYRKPLAALGPCVLVFGLCGIVARAAAAFDDLSATVGELKLLANSLPSSSQRDELVGRILQVERLASDLANRQSQIDRQKDHISVLRIEWETAEAAYRQFNGQYEADSRQTTQDVEAHNRENAEYGRRNKDHSSDVANYDRQVGDYNEENRRYEADASVYDRDVGYHNSLAPEQRSEAEYNRLVSWKARLDTWRGKLNSRVNEFQRWRQAIDARSAKEDESHRALQARAARLTARIEEVITAGGKKLLDYRLAASKKERAYIDAKSAMERQQVELSGQAEGLQADVQSLNAAIASADQGAATRNSGGKPATKPGSGGKPKFIGDRFIGRGEGETSDGATFPNSQGGDGSTEISFLKRRADGTIVTAGGEWTAKPVGKAEKVPGQGDAFYYRQEWEFQSDLGIARATIQGIETEASGTASGWLVTGPGGQSMKMRFGVQFSGNIIRLLSFSEEVE